jgi:hypothetical protein
MDLEEPARWVAVNEWTNLPWPGKCWHFFHIVESEVAYNEPIEATLAACSAVWPIMRPLSVTLHMAARSRELPYIELAIQVPATTWHLRELDIPGHVPVAARIQGRGHREQAVGELTLEELSLWIASAHDQQLPDGYVPVLYGLEMHYMRARVIDLPDRLATLRYGPEQYTVPVERRADGLWVSGPIRDTMTNPPIKLNVENNDSQLLLDICAGWSPWIEARSPEAALLQSCLHDLVSHGWDDASSE